MTGMHFTYPSPLRAPDLRHTVSALALLAVSLGLAPLANAQLLPPTPQPQEDNRTQLPADSPFQDPNIIYLEADEVINNQAVGTVIASGDVDARYQGRSLQADRVHYDINSGSVVAEGNVVLIGDDGTVQHAEKIDLSGQLESGAATGYASSLPGGGVASAAYAVRRSDEGVDLFNAYFTACQPCQDEAGEAKPPTWRLKARQVTQDKEDQMIYYRDAVLEVKSIPVFYLPYLAHPDPSAERRSGLLVPFIGASGREGLFYEQPYYLSLSDSSELTLSPRISTRVNPILGLEYNKKFYSGDLSIDASFTYEDWFDSDGDTLGSAAIFDDPSEDFTGEELRGHIFARGQFDITDNWLWGFGVEASSDDLYTDRYDIDLPSDHGLYSAESRQLVQQLYTVAQDTNYRYSASAFGFSSLRSTVTRSPSDSNLIFVDRVDDDELPVALPKIELSHYLPDPLFNGRLQAVGDATFLTRDDGDDYSRISGGLDWKKSLIVAGGIELQPFANVRADNFSLDAFDGPDRDFTRTLGQVGVDARWTFLRPGAVDMILEPRVKVTQSFGDGELENFVYTDNNNNIVNAFEDGLSLDLDAALLWNSNKATGFDLWQEGLRVDVGGSFGIDWSGNSASLFLGQSFLSDSDDEDSVFSAGTGLLGDTSDWVSEFDFRLKNRLRGAARLRINDETGNLSRTDSEIAYTGEKLTLNARYYKLDEASAIQAQLLEDSPSEEISGDVRYRFKDNWSFAYSAYRDISLNTTRRQELSFGYDDDCSVFEIFYKRNRRTGIDGDSDSIGLRIALTGLGGHSNR